MTKVIRIAANPVVAKIIDAPTEVKTAISNLLTYTVDGSQFMSSFSSWNGQSTFFSYISSTFPAGFIHLVSNELSKLGYSVQIIKKPAPEPLGEENPMVDEFGNNNPNYEYQPRSLKAVEKHSRGIIQVATGGGKTKIAKLITARYKRMTLFLTTRGVLMHQMKDAYKSMGMNVGVLGDGEWSPTKGANVAMVQTLIAKLEEPNINLEVKAVITNYTKLGLKAKKEDVYKEAKRRFDEKSIMRSKTIKILEMFEVVIGEEAHEVGGGSYYKILKHCKNAHIRIALTATPFMRDSVEDNMRLMAAFGPILIQVSEKTLIDRGILAKPIFKFVKYTPNPKLRKSSPWQRAYTLGVTDCDGRNETIVNYAVKGAEKKLPVMILIQRTGHGDVLKKLIEAKGLKVEYIRGENDQIERKSSLDKLGKGQIDVLIGTTILDVGVDVPAVGIVILAGGGKAEVALRQRIGRGLRAKKNGPNLCFVIDFQDELNFYLRDHAKQRRKIIEETPGFSENILADSEDFDWSVFK
jgi:superfamily II DNA or RNA helicase